MNKNFFFFCIFLISCTTLSAKECEYSATVWNTRLRKTTGVKKIKKPYNDLLPSEISTYNCTPCESDQVTIHLPQVPPFRVCKYIAKKVEAALLKAMDAGEKIKTVVGYRPSFTKGSPNFLGERTELSHHSFGVAIDINQAHNGLYAQCIEFDINCKLIKGGPWRKEDPLSLKQDSPITIELRNIGLKWGGEIKGKQKDFMHFSPSGY